MVEAIPRGTGQSQRSLAHVSTGAGVGGSWRQFRADLQAGAWLNPTLGGGPLGHLVLQGRTGRLGLGVDGRVGWDLAVHRTEVVRWIVGVGLWASWEGGHAP